ncbi:MAG: hypothetical protein A2X94_10415 [Bdellovibrionales bacterium GWB1_55_8]|nr:MAG: hypothetical protein A2X94_10415 [Bdellovibrionales bacterium GWB1_55_8]
MKNHFLKTPLLLFLSGVTFLSACTHPEPPSLSSSASATPSVPVAEAAPSAPLDPAIFPSEETALAEVQGSFEADAKTDDRRRETLRHFQFTSDEALKVIERIIFAEAQTLSDTDYSPAAAEKCLFLSDLFWNRVAATEYALDPVKARASLRPWLEDLALGANKQFATRANLALTLDPDWKLPEDDDAVLADIAIRSPAPCTFEGNFGFEPSHGLQQRLQNQLIIRRTLIQFKGNTPSLSFLAPQTSSPALDRLARKAEALAQISSLPTDLRTELFHHLISNSMLISPAANPPLVQRDPGIPNMYWKFSGRGELGRCLGESSSVEGTSIANFKSGKRCSLNGGPEGAFNIGINDLITTHCAGTLQRPALCFSARLFSYAKGGHRNGAFLGPGDEDQTTHIRYNVTGSATIPACNNPALCDPMLLLSYQAAHQDQAGSLIPAYGGSIVVEVEAPQLGGVIRLSPYAPISVDRSQGPIQVRVHLARDFTHIGAHGEPPVVYQGLKFLLENQTTHTNFGKPGPQSDLADMERNNLRHQFSKSAEFLAKSSGTDAPAAVLNVVAELTRGLQNVTSTFEHQLPRTYGRLLLLQSLLEENELKLGSMQLRQIQLATQAISDEARRLHLETLKFLYKDRRELLTLLPLAPLTESIARLLKMANDGDIDLDPLLSSVQPLLNALSSRTDDPAILEIVEDFREAGSSQRNLLESIASLMKIRRDLNEMRKKLEAELVLYAKELSDLTGIPASTVTAGPGAAL